MNAQNELTEMISAKSKRGRPRSAMLDMQQGVWNELTTRRSLNNRVAMTNALKALKGLPQSEYFSSRQKVRLTLVSALGRLPSEVIPEIAAYIAEEKLSTKDGINFIWMIRRETERQALEVSR